MNDRRIIIKKARNPIWIGILILSISIIVVISASTILYRRTSTLLTENLRERILTISITGAAGIDSKDLEALQIETDWGKPEWGRVVNKLHKVKYSNKDIVFMYIFRKKIFDQTKMLENSVDLVKKGRALGVQIIQVTEGYTPDHRELDWSNPGFFHRSQIARKAWKMGTWPVELYEPLRPGPSDRDILLPNRITVSGFGGNGLDTILKSRGIKNVALGGFSTDGCVYATLLSAYDLGYHVYAVKDAMTSDHTQLADLLLTDSYPKYSRVLGYRELLQMLEEFQPHPIGTKPAKQTP